MKSCMKILILFILGISITGCNLIPHQYKSASDLTTNFKDVRVFKFDDDFKTVLPEIIRSANLCGIEFRKKDIEIGGAAAASNYEIKVSEQTSTSARIEIWSVHFIDTYLYEVIDVEANQNSTVVKHYQLKEVHAGNKFRVEDLSSWYKSEKVTCE